MICNKSGNSKWLLIGLGGFVAAGITAWHGTPSRVVSASDHIDSPTIAQDRAADIGDTWAFLDPNDNSMVVMAMSTQGFLVSSEHFGQAIFDSNLRYRFEIENTGDAVPDLFVDVQYSPGVGRLTGQTATITLPGGMTFTAPTTIATQEYQPNPPVVTADSKTGARFFGGVAADPFFLDDTGANRFIASSLMNPGNPDRTLFGQRGGRNTYAGFNQLMTVISVPVAMLRGRSNLIGFNAVTQRQRNLTVQNNGTVTGSGDWVTLDRDGNPLVNNGLIPAARKNEYNGASTADDAAGRFRSDIIQALTNLGTNSTYMSMILSVVQVKGDILRLDATVPNLGEGGGTNSNGGFGNMGGRRFQDDVVDAVFTLINNGQLLSDYVNGPPKTLRNTFPFVSDPFQPFPPGSSADDGTRQ